MMRYKSLLALTGLSTLIGGTALAIDTSQTYDVRFDGERTGYWTLRNLVEDRGSNCRYTVRWQNLSRSRTVLCKIDEQKAGDYFDCEEARRNAFSTIIRKASGQSCGAFDFFGRQTSVSSLFGGQSDDGTINGVVRVASVGDVLNLEINP